MPAGPSVNFARKVCSRIDSLGACLRQQFGPRRRQAGEQFVLFERPPHQLAHREPLGLGPPFETASRALGQADGQHFFHVYDCVIHERLYVSAG